MTQKQWSALPNGQTLVNGEIPTVSDAYSIKVMREAIINRWGPLFAKESARTGVPWPWLAGIARGESVPPGNPNSISHNADTGAELAYGLMQILPEISPKYFGRVATRDEMLDPEINVYTSANYIADMIAHGINDLPSIASGYNAGWNTDKTTGKFVPRTCANYNCAKANTDTSWGPTPQDSLFAEKDYISTVVAAANYAASHMPANLAAASAGGLGPRKILLAGSVALLGIGGYLAYRKHQGR